MSWGRMDDGFDDHPKVEGLSLEAVGLWTRNWIWCHRHRKTAPLPGFIPEARVRKIAGRRTQTLVKELTTPPPGYEFGLWEPVTGGWMIHDFDKYLPKQRDPEELRAAGQKGMASRYGKANKPPSNQLDDDIANSYEPASNEIANDIATDNSRASTRAFPSRPVPSPKELTHLGGESHETLTSPPRCPKHQNLNPGEDPPCRDCKILRETWEADRAAVRAAATAARQNCTTCHGTGWIEDDHGQPILKCTHDQKAP